MLFYFQQRGNKLKNSHEWKREIDLDTLELQIDKKKKLESSKRKMMNRIQGNNNVIDGELNFGNSGIQKAMTCLSHTANSKTKQNVNSVYI